MPGLNGRRGTLRSSKTAILANTPNGNTTLFTYTGSIRLISIEGVIRGTAMQSQATVVKLVATADSLTEVDLCGTLDLTGAAIGTALNITGTLADAMVAKVNGIGISQAGYIDFTCVSSGVIEINNASAANNGQTQWSMLYDLLDPDATVTPS